MGAIGVHAHVATVQVYNHTLTLRMGLAINYIVYNADLKFDGCTTMEVKQLSLYTYYNVFVTVIIILLLCLKHLIVCTQSDPLPTMVIFSISHTTSGYTT